MNILAGSAPIIQSGATDAASYVMLGLILLILSALLAFIFRLRYLSRNPIREADELEDLMESGKEDEGPDH